VLRTLLVLGILGVGLIASLVSGFYALLLYLWWAIFRPEFFVWTDITGFRISLILGVILLVRSLMDGVYPNFSHPLSAGALAFLFCCLMSQFTAVNPDIGWQWMDYLWRLICVSLLAMSWVNSRERYVWAYGVIAASMGFYGAKAGFGSLLGGGVRYFEGMAGSFGDNNAYALAIAMVLPLLFATAQNLPRWWQRLALFTWIPLGAFGIVSLFSRGAVLALGTSALTMMALHKRRFVAIAVTLTVVLVGLEFAPIPEGWFDRVQTIQTYEQVGDESALGRLHFWRVAVDMAMDRPLGVGLKNYEAAYDQYDSSHGAFGPRRAVHNSHLQVLAETGFPGAAVWLFLLGYCVVLIFRIRRRSRQAGLSPADASFMLTMANGLIASMMGFVVGGTFLAMALNDITWLTFALVASLDRISLALCAEAARVPGQQAASVPPIVEAARRPQTAFTFAGRR
jgi:probable O-glycosylation ligase (exosortase A-associated)